jgi:hypothetical protein
VAGTGSGTGSGVCANRAAGKKREAAKVTPTTRLRITRRVLSGDKGDSRALNVMVRSTG